MSFSRLTALALLGLVVPLAACGGTGSGTTTDAGVSGDAGSPTDGGTALGFTPSNVDLGAFDLSAADDVILSGTNCPLDGETPDGPTFLLCAQDTNLRVAHKIVTLPDQTRLSVFVVKSLRIEAGTVLDISRGHLPIVFVALGTMELLGSINVAPGSTGGSLDHMTNAKGGGAGGGPAGDSNGLAGGGASYCGLGGKGGTNTNLGGPPPIAPTPAYGAAELVPLVGGSAGGTAIASADGAGGGALELVAGKGFTLHAGAFISVGGGGGAFGGQGKLGGNGAGSGGSLLIESPSVTIDGNLAANGGGGGQGGGNADSGEPGHADKVAQGGHKANEGAPAGNGSFGAAIDGGDGPSSTDPFVGGGGGGGGAGRIRLNTTAGAATITGALSPPTTSSCATQGTLKK